MNFRERDIIKRGRGRERDLGRGRGRGKERERERKREKERERERESGGEGGEEELERTKKENEDFFLMKGLFSQHLTAAMKFVLHCEMFRETQLKRKFTIYILFMKLF